MLEKNEIDKHHGSSHINHTSVDRMSYNPSLNGGINPPNALNQRKEGVNMAREIRKDQNYRDRLLKLIPSEIVAAYMVLAGIIPEDKAKWGTLIVSIVLLVLVPFYLWKMQNVQRNSQVIFTMISFVVWLYSLGGPFEVWGLYEAWIGSIILVLWTLIIPLVVNPKSQPATP